MRTAAVLFVLSLAVRAQDSSTISLDNGVQIRIEANFGNPTGQQTLGVQMVRATGNSFYRIFRDQTRLAVYAYQLFFDLSGNGAAVTATARAYDGQFIEQFPLADGGKPTPSLALEMPLGSIESGKAATLDLFAIPGVGVHVTETISVEVDSEHSAGPLRLADLQIAINGRPIPLAQQLPVSGRFAMFYLPGRGGYFLSVTDPGRGFLKAGVVDGRSMKFFINNDQYEGTTSQSILTRPESGELWVLYVPDYRPGGNWTTHPRTGESRPAVDEFFAASSDTLNWWLR